MSCVAESRARESTTRRPQPSALSPSRTPTRHAPAEARRASRAAGRACQRNCQIYMARFANDGMAVGHQELAAVAAVALSTGIRQGPLLGRSRTAARAVKRRNFLYQEGWQYPLDGAKAIVGLVQCKLAGRTLLSD